MAKTDAKLRLTRLVLVLKEFEFDINDQKGYENQVCKHLSRS